MNPINTSLSVHADPTKEPFQFDALDAEYRDELAEHARSMVDVAREGFGIELDGSRASLEGLEQVLADCAEHMAQAGISAASEQSQMLIAMAGAYLGEVFRQTTGGQRGSGSRGSGSHAGRGQASNLNPQSKKTGHARDLWRPSEI